MNSIQSLKNGDLQGALAKLKGEIRDNPSEPKHRVFLFQLLSILGQWEKALDQLNVLRDLKAEHLSLVQTYQETLNCEALRTSVFAGERSPLLFGEPEPWMALMLEGLKWTCQGSLAQGETLRAKALEEAPTSAGQLVLHAAKKEEGTSQPTIAFEWIADADSRIGPFLEAIVHGKYFWIPFHRIRSVAFEKATDLRDLVWLPARFEWVNGGDAVGFIPTRYPQSESADDDHLKLGWKTHWTEASEQTYLGLGQRILATDVEEFALTQIQKITFQSE